jgi:uncharacterized protein (DUF169 family)
MKMSKAEWKALSERYELAMRPTQHAVAMKFIRTQEEFDAIPELKYFQNPGTGCKAIGMCANFPMTVGITTDKFMTTYCAANCGCCGRDQEWHDGVLLSSPPFQWHHDAADSKKHMVALEKALPEQPYIGIACSTLGCNTIEEPDVIALQLPSQAAFHLMAGFVEIDYQQVQFNYSGESNCADTWMLTLKTGKPGLSLGCRGDRATGGLQNGDVRITMTAEDLVKALDGVDRLAADGIDYPYFACNMLKDEF